MEIVLSKSTLRLPLFVALSVVAGTGVLVEVLGAAYRWSTQSGALPFFSMSYEGNLPTFYSAAILALASLLLSIAAASAKKAGERFVAHWWVLCLGFAYIAVDEVFELHEMAGSFVQLSGVLYFSWVIPASILVTILGFSYVSFLRYLPARTRNRFILAGAIYVTGAVVMELPLGYWTDKHGSHNLVYGLIDAVEETMEMVGINLFILWLVDYLGEKRILVRFSESQQS